MNDEDKQRMHEGLIEAKFSMLDRMQAAGWINGFKRDNNDALVQLTPEGRSIMKEVERLFYFNGKQATQWELIAFVRLIKEFENI